MSDALARLEAVIAARREASPDGSYTAKLFAQGRPLQARKLGEEAVELVVASLAQDHAAIVAESADLLFHLMVLLADAGVPFADVLAELERREGTSGLTEKAARAAG